MTQKTSGAPSHLSVVPALAETSDEADQFVPTLLSVAKRTRALFGIKLGEAGFHNGQDQLLVALQNENPVSVSVLAHTLDVRPSTVSKMIDRLAEKGLVRRLTDSADGRRTIVSITPAGIEARDFILRIWDAVAAELLSTIGNRSGELAAELRVLDLHLSRKLLRIR